MIEFVDDDTGELLYGPEPLGYSANLRIPITGDRLRLRREPAPRQVRGVLFDFAADRVRVTLGPCEEF